MGTRHAEEGRKAKKDTYDIKAKCYWGWSEEGEKETGEENEKLYLKNVTIKFYNFRLIMQK